MATKSTLMEKLLKTGSVGSTILSESEIFKDKDLVRASLPIINIAFSGRVDGGFAPGLTILAGESKTFKSALSLYCMKAYLDKYDDAVGILYDSEFGVTPEYIKGFGIDPARVIHIPVEHVEQLKFDFVKKLEEIKKGDHVFFMVDSIGQISSKKEVEDAASEKSVADMTRAKAIRSLLRLITIQLSMKNLPCFMINHVYIEIGCLDGGTLIDTERGLVAIRDIKIGDFVVTPNGLKCVEYVYTPNQIPTIGKKFLEMTLDDGSTILCTDNHKFLGSDGTWVVARDLAPGSEI